jgi:hypothetical protein
VDDKIGTEQNPIHMKWIPPQIKPVKTIVFQTLMVAIPIGVAMIMQRPDLRQMLTMRVWHGIKTFSQANADFWQANAINAATKYNRARL